MKTIFVVIVLVFSLSGCGTTSGIYDPQPWAKVSYAQAEAECYNFINSAEGRGSNFYLCMKAKGWIER